MNNADFGARAVAESSTCADAAAISTAWGVQARIGGKGTVRRKAKAVTKTASSDDKKLVSTLKRLGVNTIPGIEEVSIFKDDGSAIVFSGPKGW